MDLCKPLLTLFSPLWVFLYCHRIRLQTIMSPQQCFNLCLFSFLSLSPLLPQLVNAGLLAVLVFVLLVATTVVMVMAATGAASTR